MANEIQFDAATSGIASSIYAVLTNSIGQFRRTDTNAWESYSATNWQANAYRVTVTEQGSTAIYLASLPSGVTAADGVTARLYYRMGASDDPTDPIEAAGVIADRTGYALSTAGVTAVQSGLSTLTAAQVNAEADTALADVGLTSTITGRIDASISGVAASAATAVWASGSRTLTSFGALVSDIATAVWSAVTRTLTSGSGGATAQEVWEYSTRTLTSGSGTGARTITITVNDGTTPLQNAIVRFTEGVNTFTATTNGSGVAVFGLDDATYSVAITKPGYSYTPTTYAVTATAAITRSMTAVSITPSPEPGQATGVLVCYENDGTTAAGVVVTFKLVEGTGDAGSSLSTAKLTVTSDSAGVVEVTGMWIGATYVGYRGDENKGERFEVPNAASFNIPEIIGRP